MHPLPAAPHQPPTALPTCPGCNTPRAGGGGGGAVGRREGGGGTSLAGPAAASPTPVPIFVSERELLAEAAAMAIPLVGASQNAVVCHASSCRL